MEPFLTMIAPIVTLIGGAIVTFVYMRNREDREPASSQRSETDKLFQFGFERAPVGIAYLSPDGSWLHVNQRVLQLLGYERSDFAKTSLRTLTHSEDRKREAAMMAAMRAGRTRGFTINKRLRKNDGTYQTYRFSIVRVGGGSHHVFQCVIDEIAEEVERQNDLVSVFDRVPEVSVIRINPDGMITSWNRGAAELFGYSEAEMTGKPWTRLHATAVGRSGEATRELTIAASSGKFEGTDSRRKSDDSILSVEIVIVPQFRGKDLTGFIEIARDATLSHTALEYKIAYEREKQLHEKKVESLTLTNEKLRNQVARQEEMATSMREAQERLRDNNRELTGRIKVFSAAVRKLIDQRKELEETIRTERQERTATAEELSSALPADLDWSPFDGPADAVLSDRLESEVSGVLVFRSGELEKRLTLRSGGIAACSSNSPQLLLGQMLVDEKAITEPDREKMIEVQDQTGIAFGRLLLLFELMTEREIREAMERKISRELQELGEWSSGEWAFYESEIEPLQIVPVEVSIHQEPEGQPSSALETDDRDSIGETDVEARSGGERDAGVARDDRAEEPTADRHLGAKDEPEADLFVASDSSRSTRYHRQSCSSVARIPKKSRVSFSRHEDAEARGLSPCKRCIEEVASVASR